MTYLRSTVGTTVHMTFWWIGLETINESRLNYSLSTSYMGDVIGSMTVSKTVRQGSNPCLYV